MSTEVRELAQRCLLENKKENVCIRCRMYFVCIAYICMYERKENTLCYVWMQLCVCVNCGVAQPLTSGAKPPHPLTRRPHMLLRKMKIEK